MHYYGQDYEREWVDKFIILPLNINKNDIDENFYRVIWEAQTDWNGLYKLAEEYVNRKKFKENFNTLLKD